MNNPNHPKKGRTIKVEPIRNLNDISSIKNLLKPKPRDYAIFILGINTNLRASDILSLTVSQIRNLSIGNTIHLKEKKTQKNRTITINKSVYEALSSLLKTLHNPQDNDLIFQSQRKSKTLTVPSLNNLVKSWCSSVNLKGNYGSHTLRKTFGFIHRTVFKTNILYLMDVYNHTNQRQTLSYLCIQPEEIKTVYMKNI